MPYQSDLKNFENQFRTENDCREFILNIKTKDGFRCFKCGHKEFWKGRTWSHRRCKNCCYDESVLANTAFHNLRISLLKAFGMTYHICFIKSGISSMDLAHLYSVNQKSAWYFKRKLQQALNGAQLPDKKISLEKRDLCIDSVLISRRATGANGLQKVHLLTEEFKIPKSSAKMLVAKSSMPDPGKKIQSDLLKGKFKQANPDINMWNFKACLTGTHHHCSEKYLQGYVDEFMFKRNYSDPRSNIWRQLITLLVNTNPGNTTICAQNG